MEDLSLDATKSIILGEINRDPGEREALEQKYGQVWNTNDLRTEFDVLGFSAPFVVVTQKSTGFKGSMMFQHQPRYYFEFSKDSQ